MHERPVHGGWLLGAGVEVVAPDGRLLMIERERFGSVEWSGAGGGLERGESIEDCARRETFEESGLNVRLERLIRVSEFWEGDRLTGVGFVFLGSPHPWPQEVRLPSIDGITRFRSYRWCTRDEVAQLPRWSHHITHVAWPPEVTVIRIDRIDSVSSPRIRRARPDEAEALNALAMRSKAHWGYDAAFMKRIGEAMTISPAEVVAHETWVLEDASGGFVGWHRVIAGDPAVVEDLWVEPDAMGIGQGRLLFEHAVEVARAGGSTVIELDADPNAVGFYERMGMVRVGETPSKLVPGRNLPRMRLDLAE
jgi:ADP-ribose pyrophosphatase YjhB (NUDIX family)/ribosomal protein S18 acetylase RimI-like enzyme